MVPDILTSEFEKSWKFPWGVDQIWLTPPPHIQPAIFSYEKSNQTTSDTHIHGEGGKAMGVQGIKTYSDALLEVTHR